MTAVTKPRFLPCPFCGRVKYLDIERRLGNIFVTCDNCYCEGPGSEVDCRDPRFGYIKTETAAIAAWNRRARREK